MKRILLICLCFLVLIGCQNGETHNNDKLTDEEINIKYEEMKNKLIEYGKLIYENDQWLNNSAEPITSYMTLKEMSKNNKYDVSMFVDPKTGKKCDDEQTKIEFIITDVDSLGNIKYEFNPVLFCEDKIVDLEDNEDASKNENDLNYENDESYDLHNVLVGYMVEIYKNDKYMNGGLEPNLYKVSLREFEQKGYNISMFVNNETHEKCDLDNTYGMFEVFGDTSDGKTDYLFGANLDC